MLSVEEYRGRLLEGVSRLAVRTVALPDSVGRASAYDVYSHLDLPPYDAAAMDGFAVRAEDLAGADRGCPVTMSIAGEIRMGAGADADIGPTRAVAVSTGGRLPAGADSVVPWEQCIQDGSAVTFTSPVQAGRHIRRRGEDLHRGDLVVRAGRRLAPGDIAALAAVGRTSARVVSAPAVAILSTGDELTAPGDELAFGRIYDLNSSMLSAQVSELGGISVPCGHVPDDPSALVRAMGQVVDGVDLILCSGGVSAGSRDPVRAAAGRGVEAKCIQVAMKPGRPQAFGRFRNRPFIALPGTPAAALISFQVFVRPVLNKMMGLSPGDGSVAGVVGEAMAGQDGVDRFVPVRRNPVTGEWLEAGSREKSSGRLTSVTSAEGLVRIRPGKHLEAGETAEILLLADR